MPLDRIKKNFVDPNTLVQRWFRESTGESDNIMLGSQLIVNESQEAVFFKGGQALDVFKPGTHTLSTKNLPVLGSLFVDPVFGNKTPFSAEIYFVNKTSNLSYKWGTDTPMLIEDPKLKVLISVSCRGQFGLKVQDSRVFVTQIVGTISTWNTAKILEYFRGAIKSRVKDSVAKYLLQNSQSLLTVNSNIDEISKIVEDRLKDEFAKYGIELLRFFVENIAIPENQLEKIQKGSFARLEVDQLGDDRYKMIRSLDIMNNAAQNTGSAGTFMAAGVGLGAGSAMVTPFAEKAQEALSAASTLNNQTQSTCPKCNANLPQDSKFCVLCGNKIESVAICSSCKAQLNGNEVFCHQCGTKVSGSPSCSGCGATVKSGMKFCPQCGKTIN